MRELRYAPLWLLVGCLLLGAVAAASLAPVPQGIHMLSDKLLHLLTYLALGLWFGAIYRRERFARLGFGLVAIGVVIECLQFTTGYRSFELADILADALGTTGGLVLAATPLGGTLLLIESRLPHRD